MGQHIREDRFTSIDIQNVINGPRTGECAPCLSIVVNAV